MLVKAQSGHSLAFGGFKVIQGHLVYGKLCQPGVLKMALRRVEEIDISDSGTLITHIWGTFDLFVAPSVSWCYLMDLYQN